MDHKVRKESTEEAEKVGKLLTERGIEHKIVACEWPRGLPVSAPQVFPPLPFLPRKIREKE